MTSIAKELLAESQAAVKASGEEVYSTRRDLLSLMVKSNMSKDQENARLSDADVIARMSPCSSIFRQLSAYHACRDPDFLRRRPRDNKVCFHCVGKG